MNELLLLWPVDQGEFCETVSEVGEEGRHMGMSVRNVRNVRNVRSVRRSGIVILLNCLFSMLLKNASKGKTPYFSVLCFF